jgi:hypothetical protein
VLILEVDITSKYGEAIAVKDINIVLVLLIGML